MYYFFPLIPIVYLWLGWSIYVMIMGMYRAYLDDRLKGLKLVMSAPWIAVGVIMDISANLFLAPLIFLDYPKEWLVTSRLQRYMKTESGWRRTIAEYVCENLLDIFDPSGEHC
jgi:hypothetical protein